MVKKLVAALEDDFRPEEYADEYRDRVLKYIEAKGERAKTETRNNYGTQSHEITKSLLSHFDLALIGSVSQWRLELSGGNHLACVSERNEE